MRLAALLLLLTVTAGAKDKHAPLPDELLKAKTVFIENDSQFAFIYDQAYSELKKWGKFQLVHDRDAADLIFQLQSHDDRTDATRSSGMAGNTPVSVTTPGAGSCSTTLTIVTPSAHQVFVNTLRCSKHGASTDLIRDLRSRF